MTPVDGVTAEYEASTPKGGNALSTTVYRMPVVARRLLLVAWDGLSWLLAMLAFLLVRYDFNLSNAQWDWVLAYTAIAVALQIGAGLATQLYLGRNRIGSFAEASWMGGPRRGHRPSARTRLQRRLR